MDLNSIIELPDDAQDAALQVALSEFADRLGGLFSTKTAQAMELESYGWKTWLRTLMPNTFRAPFAHEQEQFWEIWWRILKKREKGIPLSPKETELCLFFSRGFGKSTNGEAACIGEGCVAGFGLDLYVCDTKDMAEDHLYSISEILNNGQVGQFYPNMARPQIRENGQKSEYSQKELMTAQGWGVQARGLRQNVRGGRKGASRFTIIIADDFDSLNDSPAVTMKKIRTLTRTILPAADLKESMFLFLQNLITEHSLATQIVEKKTDVLSGATIISGAPVKAFKEIEIKTSQDEKTGRERHEIIHCVPTWEYLDVNAAKVFLRRSAKEAFLAEYQHEFKTKKGRIVPDLSRERNVITWSQFESIVGSRFIPYHWKRKVGADFGYSLNSRSAWAFVATAAENSPLAGKKFFYRGLVFTEKSPDFQFLNVWKSFFPRPERGQDFFEMEINFGRHPNLYRSLMLDQRCRPYLENYQYSDMTLLYHHPRHQDQAFFESIVEQLQISHEKSGELKTAHEQYSLPLEKMKDFGAASGTSQWNSMALGDMTKPHPFKEDELADELLGIYTLGCPDLFYIIEDEEIDSTTGVMQFVENAENWKMAPQNLTEAGFTDEKPMKYNSDTCDAERAIYATFGAGKTEMTLAEKFDRWVLGNRPQLAPETIKQMNSQQMGFAILERNLEREEFEKRNSRVTVPADMAWTQF